jgi:hypothetical protein
MKLNIDLNKIALKSLEFVKNNPVLCIGTAIGGYMFIRNYFRTKHIEKEIDNLKSNSLVQETLRRNR